MQYIIVCVENADETEGLAQAIAEAGFDSYIADESAEPAIKPLIENAEEIDGNSDDEEQSTDDGQDDQQMVE